jgi:hypothetical protein
MSSGGGFVGAGVIGLPVDVKEGGQRVDFKTLNKVNDTAFDLLIETKCPRYAWARGALCPCTGPNPQSQQPDPECTLCNAVGWLYFTPHEYVADEKAIGALDPAQCAIVAKAKAVVIKALMVSATSQPDIYTVLGRWAFGSASCTVRPGNKLGYYDRIISLDDTMVYSEVIEADGTSLIEPRYPICALNLVRSVATEYTEHDLTVVAGEIVWNTGKEPAAGTRIALHYICRPAWVVMEHSKLNRTTLVKQKKSRTTTPQGDIVHLPQQVMVRLEHLPLNPE